jgi:hypothetical protein
VPSAETIDLNVGLVELVLDEFPDRFVRQLEPSDRYRRAKRLAGGFAQALEVLSSPYAQRGQWP